MRKTLATLFHCLGFFGIARTNPASRPAAQTRREPGGRRLTWGEAGRPHAPGAVDRPGRNVALLRQKSRLARLVYARKRKPKAANQNQSAHLVFGGGLGDLVTVSLTIFCIGYQSSEVDPVGGCCEKRSPPSDDCTPSRCGIRCSIRGAIHPGRRTSELPPHAGGGERHILGQEPCVGVSEVTMERLRSASIRRGLDRLGARSRQGVLSQRKAGLSDSCDLPQLGQPSQMGVLL